MFDDLRPKGSSFEDEEEQEPEIEEAPPAKAAKKKRTSDSGEIPILGMTAAQRLVIAIMLFLNVTVLGCFLLLATESVVLF